MMGERTNGVSPSGTSTANRLDSWKEIAAYVKRDVTTVQRWEKREGMPVHRHLHDKRGSAYAIPSELDEWMQSRRLRPEEEEEGRGADLVGKDESEDLPGRTSQPYLRLVLGGIAALALISAAGYFIIRTHERQTQPKITSLVVLPLKNLSSDPAQDYLADGMTESIIGRLSTIHGLRVISRTSAMHFKDTRLSAPEIAKALNVDALVEGSVMREGGRVRVHAQLIRAATDEHFWSETYDRELSDVLELESDVAQAIAGRVEVTVTGQERARLVASRHVDPEVYESYLRGMSQLAHGNTKAEIERSIAYFDEAIKRDSTYAPAYLGLASAYGGLSTIFVGGPPSDLRPKILAAARKALELDPELAEAHVILGDIDQVHWQWRDAETEYRSALELKPNDASAQFGMADWLLCQGRTDEALAWAERGRELDPLGNGGVDIAWILFQGRRYDDAIRELHSFLAVHPDDASAWWSLGFALIGKGQPQEAVTVLEKTAALMHRSPGSLELLATAYASAGQRAKALRILGEMRQHQRLGYYPPGAFINPNLALRDYDEAFVWFERAYQEHSNILQFLKVHPFFDPVRGDPRFKDLLHRVDLDH